MSFKRNLYVDQWGRLRPKHDRFSEDSFDISDWGYTCKCCSFGCTPDLQRRSEPWKDVWRFEIDKQVRDAFDSRHKQFKWLEKRFPRLMRRLSDDPGVQAEDEVHWFYTPREQNKYRWWWTRVVEKYGGLR